MSYVVRNLSADEQKYMFDQTPSIKSKSGYIGYAREDVDNLNLINEIDWLNVFENRVSDKVKRDIKELLNIRNEYENFGRFISFQSNMDNRRLFMYENICYYGVRVDINSTTFLIRLSRLVSKPSMAVFVYNTKEYDHHRNEAKTKGIRIIDSHYKTLFTIQDGDQIKMISANGKYFMPTCRYLDEYHLEVGGSCYHICQFAELMEQKNNTVIPIRKSLPDECYIYDEDNDIIGILEKGANEYNQVPIKTKNADEAKAFVNSHNKGLGISNIQALAMLSGCKYGWADKRADPDNYDDKGKFKETRDKSQEAR